MFSVIMPVLDPFDRFVQAGAIQSTLDKALDMEGNFELIVVNNNSVDTSPQLTQYLKSLAGLYAGKIKIVEPGTNLGTARGFNAGLKVAQPDSEYLVFMSTDADIVDPAILVKIQEVMESHPRLGIAHPVSVFEDLDQYNFSSKYGIKTFRKMIRYPYLFESFEIPVGELNQILEDVSRRSGIKAPLPATPLTFAVYRREMITQIGSFDEGVEFGCYETDDLCYRALLNGYNVGRLNGIFVNHRRMYFRRLVIGGTREANALPHSKIIKQSAAWWNEKWGRPYPELYAQWRWGQPLFTLMLPYFWLRRVGSALKRAARTRKA